MAAASSPIRNLVFDLDGVLCSELAELRPHEELHFRKYGHVITLQSPKGPRTEYIFPGVIEPTRLSDLYTT
jgi:FMN phosphatase YigB (HAD superfamily)